MLTLLLCGSCTEEFDYTIPPKYPDNPVAPTVYDVTLSGLLDEMVSLEEAALYPSLAYTTHQASSYDRHSVTPGTPGWFANYDGLGYIRKEVNEGRTEMVMMEHEGPGVITRIWLTSLTDKDAVIRFYFDGSEKPDWTIGSFNLKEFDTPLQEAGVSPLGRGFVQPVTGWHRGSNLWLPIPFGKGCKVTFEERSQTPEPTRYFQINYRAYPQGTAVETFSTKVFNACRGKVAQIDSRLTEPKSRVAGRLLEAADELAPQQSLRLELPGGARAVTELVIEVSGNGANIAEIMDGAIFLARFDGTVTAGLPLSDLGMGGPGAPAVSNYFVDSSGGSVRMRMIMPYAATGTLAVRNTSPYRVRVKISARAGSFPRDDRTLYFHAASKREAGLKIPLWNDPANCYDWNFATIRGGRGVLRADMFSMDNHTYIWPGEGDEKIWIDGETFPSHFGTGLEDYYCFCHELRYQYPFAGEPRLDSDNFNGVNTYHRVRCLDAIPFASELRFDLEMQGHEAGTADVRNAVFWYGDLGTRAVGMDEYAFE